jgi:hypothetical protein
MDQIAVLDEQALDIGPTALAELREQLTTLPVWPALDRLSNLAAKAGALRGN